MSSPQTGKSASGVIIPAIIGLLLAGAAAFGIISAATGTSGEQKDPNQQVAQYGNN